MLQHSKQTAPLPVVLSKLFRGLNLLVAPDLFLSLLKGLCIQQHWHCWMSKVFNSKLVNYAGRTTATKISKAGSQGKEHSGKRFAASKRGAGGDVKGKSSVEPYAYWPLDRKMLNRRSAKKAEAKHGLTDIVSNGVAKGRKSKKQRR